MEFIRTQVSDIPMVMEIIKEGQNYFKANNIPQWNNGYPNEDTILQDIESGSSYILVEDGNILATAALVYGIEPTYNKIFQGEWLVDLDNYLTLHRVAVKSGMKGRGLGGRIVDFAMEDASLKGCKSIRIDTHKLNLPMQAMIKKSGFSYCGIIYLANGDERMAFEKVLV